MKINKVDYVIETHEKPQKKRKTKIQIKMDKLEKRETALNERATAMDSRESKIMALETKYRDIAKKHNTAVQSLLDRETALNNEKLQLLAYTESQFKKDLERHTMYMSKGMTEKAEKLEQIITKKIKKTEKTTNRMK